ncbi:hypothetical protein [Plesiomonas sp. PI-19]|uniref:hypothetical protein n=1 Tax=Plesiomonas sp. PI-19 TaxID=2898798 RepID=UPI001F21DF14|nr:hypothetical protein [Plesiomonas sp. PI-19]MCE5165624.1 hypothetical protein [Plesiomonas sp. PI-19]
MTTVRFYAVVVVIIYCCGYTAYTFCGDASTEQLNALAGHAKLLQSPEFNQALQDALSDGKITRMECYRLNGMAKRLERKMRRAQNEIERQKAVKELKTFTE